MTNAVFCSLLMILTSALEAPEGRSVRANYLVTVTDDFIVDVYSRGRTGTERHCGVRERTPGSRSSSGKRSRDPRRSYRRL